MFALRLTFLGALLLACAQWLGSAQCRSLPRIQVLAEQGYQPGVHWFMAAQLGSAGASESLAQLSIETNNAHWLNLSAELGAASALYHLASEESDPQVHLQLLHQAAKQGHAESQYELAIQGETGRRKLQWLKRAAQNGHQGATVSLYQWYELHNEPTRALDWLVRAAEFDAASAFAYARHLWRQQAYQKAKGVFKRAAAMGNENAKAYLVHISRYWRKEISPRLVVGEQHLSCAIQLQPVATSLEASMQAERFLNQFKADQRLQALPICMMQPVWIAADQLACKEIRAAERVACDLGPVSRLAEQWQFSHLVIFAEQGKAHVNNGIMYLDLADSYSVFVHELAHFAGFVDEYPLSAELAGQHCEQTQAPNLIIAADSERPDLQGMADWLDVGGQIQLTKARTCNNHQAQAYKPSSEMTFLEYHDQGEIPEIYLRLWQKQLASAQTLVPAYVNFAQYHRRNNPQLADYWWQRYQRWIASTELSIGG